MRKEPIFKTFGVFLLVALAAQVAFAAAAGDLKGAEKLFIAGQYAQAEQVYQAVIQGVEPNKPDALESAFTARKRLPLVYLATERLPQAQTAVQELLTKNPAHERLPHAIHEIIEQAKKLDKLALSKVEGMPQIARVYQDILSAQPGHPQAIWLKMGTAIANAHLNNDEVVNSTLQNIIAQHAADDRAAEALGQTAWAYRKLNQPEKARSVYQYVVDNWPKKDRAIFSQRGIVLCSIAMEDYEGTEAGLQKLLAAYAAGSATGNKYMPEIVRNIAGEYYRKGKVAEASGLHQYVAEKYPKSPEALWSQRDVALCCIDAGNEEAAADALEKLATNFTAHERLPEALGDVAGYYRKKGKPAEAAAVRQYLVDKHPESAEALFSQRDVVLQEIAAGNEQAAETELQKLAAAFASHAQLPEALATVAERCRRKGDYENARRICQYIIDKWPQTEAAAIAETAAAEVDILALVQSGKEDAVQAALKNLMARYKTDPALPRILAHVGDKYQTLRQYENAVAMYRQVIELVPGSERAADVQGAIGWTYIMQELYDQAITEYAKVPEIYPETKWAPHGQYWVAQCYYKKGDLERAITEYQKVIDVYPGSQQAGYATKKIATIHRLQENVYRPGEQKRQAETGQASSACGPSALIAIGHLLGVELDDKEIADLANMDDQGLTSIYDLAQAARAKGLKATGMKLGMQDLRNLGKPVIAFLRGGHFNVVKEVTETGVVITNKDASETQIRRDEFQQTWDGYVLLVEKAA